MLKVSLVLRKKRGVGRNFFWARTASLLVGCGSFILKTRHRVFLNTFLLNHIGCGMCGFVLSCGGGICF